jgi:hypothetical protein
VVDIIAESGRKSLPSAITDRYRPHLLFKVFYHDQLHVFILILFFIFDPPIFGGSVFCITVNIMFRQTAPFLP